MICICLSRISFSEVLSIVKKEKFCEIRIDLLNLNDEEIKIVFRQSSKLIATCHPFNHSLKYSIEKLRLAIDAGASYIDIDINLSSELKELIDYAKQNNCKVIISYHNFQFTPDSSSLINVIEESFVLGADIAKVACMVNNNKDNQIILSLYEKFMKNLVAIGMGNLAKRTRWEALLKGAPFTYACLYKGKETALGQMDKKTMLNLLNKAGSQLPIIV